MDWSELNWPELQDLNKLTQLPDEFIGRARQRNDRASRWLAAAKLGQLELG